jgi:hypothetical protein
LGLRLRKIRSSFPGEDLIVKGHGLTEDFIDLEEEDTELYHIQIVIIQKRKRQPIKKIDYTLGKKRLKGEKTKIVKS